MEKTTKTPLTTTEKQLEWLKNEVERDTIELESEKKILIEHIKKFKKEDIVKPKIEEKITLWKRIKKVLMGI
jgi:hypothetical protein